MILNCNHVEKYFTDQCIVKDATFYINDQERVALVGINGAGKTTLLRIIVGELLPDSGELIKGKDASFGYLPQQQAYHSDHTIYDELLAVKEDIITLDLELRKTEEAMKDADADALESLLKRYHFLQTEFEKKDGYAYKSHVMGVINGLGFASDDIHQSINTLSGGQKTRVALGKLLLTSPELLILDEPTNHLDLESIAWLESYLLHYKGSVLIVSHDRFFLDRIATKVVEIEVGRVSTFSGNYSDYVEKKEARRIAEENQYQKQQQEIKHQEDVIVKLRSFNREKSIKRAESRVKMLDKIERVDKPIAMQNAIHFQLNPQTLSGTDVLSVVDYGKSFDQNLLFQAINFEIKRGEKVAILGKNGTGKTTLLKMIYGLIPSTAGTSTIGANVEIGYYDQEHNTLSEEKTIFQEISDDYPTLDNTQIRNVLAAFLFYGDDVFKSIKLLSGGEKGRVSLAKLMLSEANFLLLDEPTNHLDIASKEILENAIAHYSGTVLYVSHDRYFINKTATRILDLTMQKILSYDGNYQYYLEKKDTLENVYLDSSSPIPSEEPTSEAKVDWQQQKQAQAEKRKLETAIANVEKRITQWETKIADVSHELNNPENASNVSKLIELTTKKDSYEDQLLAAMEEWETLTTSPAYDQ